MSKNNTPSSALQQQIDSSITLVNWLIEKLDNIEIKNDQRSFLAGCLYDITVEHFFGIVKLIETKVYSSAFALLRVQFESLVRGCWIQVSASNTQIEKFIYKDKISQTVNELITAIESHPNFSDNILSNLKNHSWTALNSYTHTGMLQLERRIKGNVIFPNYSDDEIVELLKTAGTFALFGLQEISRMANRTELTDTIAVMLKDGVIQTTAYTTVG
jgi:hypothetical protein